MATQAVGNNDEPLLVRPAEAARLLSISRSAVYELIARNEIPGIVRIGRSVRISLAALRGWIDQMVALAANGNDAPGCRAAPIRGLR